jgi:alcohol dehydrogenase, propanol-preferring
LGRQRESARRRAGHCRRLPSLLSSSAATKRSLWSGEIRLKVEACAVCRTDLHVVDGDLPHPKLPLVPGHEIVGIIEAVGEDVDPARIGRRVGVPWLGHTCGSCPYCRSGAENLCDRPLFTGYTRDGGFATHVVADAAYAFDLDREANAMSLAPLLCAGLIGWRSLERNCG